MKCRAESRRYVETWLGRRRYLPGIISTDWGKKCVNDCERQFTKQFARMNEHERSSCSSSSHAQRCALNTPIQGTAADMLKLALGRILAGLPERLWLMPLLQIHDELVFEVPEGRVAEAVAFIKQCMEAQPFPAFDVPVLAEADVGPRFGEMKGVET